jgi:hypothetical protein
MSARLTAGLSDAGAERIVTSWAEAEDLFTAL